MFLFLDETDTENASLCCRECCQRIRSFTFL